MTWAKDLRGQVEQEFRAAQLRRRGLVAIVADDPIDWKPSSVTPSHRRRIVTLEPRSER